MIFEHHTVFRSILFYVHVQLPMHKMRQMASSRGNANTIKGSDHLIFMEWGGGGGSKIKKKKKKKRTEFYQTGSHC